MPAFLTAFPALGLLCNIFGALRERLHVCEFLLALGNKLYEFKLGLHGVAERVDLILFVV
jgi:hypothetical protein